jgi:hypothetical protein
MIANRHASVALVRHVLAVLPLTCLPMAMAPAGESADAAAKATAPPHRSHIQPVGEIAVVSSNADTLGLKLTRASEVLRQQLALSRGAGLVVEEVVAGSPAEKAGFKQHDVLVLLDDQMLLLPEQLAALLEAATGNAAPQCTLLRGGAKVTISLGTSDQPAQPAAARAPKSARQPTLAGSPTMAREPAAPTVRQTAKPSTGPRLRAPASALALVQPATNSGAVGGRSPAVADETLFRQDADYQIKLSRGGETRLVVTDSKGAVVFNGEIDTPERRSLVPPAVRQRVEEMERSLESTSQSPAVEIGRLDVSPVEIR